MTDNNSESNNANESLPNESVDYSSWYLYSILVGRKELSKTVYVLASQFQSKEELREQVKEKTDWTFLAIRDVQPAKMISKRMKLWLKLTDEERAICERATAQFVYQRSVERGIIPA